MLHCTVDFVADTGDAQWETGGGTLCAAYGRQPVQGVRDAGASGGVQSTATERGDVRHVDRGGVDLFERARNPDATGLTKRRLTAETLRTQRNTERFNTKAQWHRDAES